MEIDNRILATSSTMLGQRTIIALEGDVDLESTMGLDDEFAEAAYAGAQPVTLDMSRLRLIDAAAISSVLRGMNTVRAAGADLDVRYPSPMALQLFELSNLLQIVGIEFALDPEKLLDDRAATRSTDEVSDPRGLGDCELPGFGTGRSRAEAR